MTASLDQVFPVELEYIGQDGCVSVRESDDTSRSVLLVCHGRYGMHSPRLGHWVGNTRSLTSVNKYLPTWNAIKDLVIAVHRFRYKNHNY